MHVKPNPC